MFDSILQFIIQELLTTFAFSLIILLAIAPFLILYKLIRGRTCELCHKIRYADFELQKKFDETHQQTILRQNRIIMHQQTIIETLNRRLQYK